MGFSCALIVETFSDLVQLHSGRGEIIAERPCNPQSPTEGGIVFCPDSEALAASLDSPVSVIVTTPGLATQARTFPEGKAILVSNQLQLAMARINMKFFPVLESRKPFDGTRIHPTAVISTSARVANTAIIGPHAVVDAGAIIGENVMIGPHSTVESGAVIGDESHIHAQVFIGHHVEIGRNCEIKPHSAIGTDGYGFAQDQRGRSFKKPHYGTVRIGDNVSIGCGVFIDRGTFEDAVIGEGTKIDNYCHFGHNVKIGKHCLITAGLITAGSVTIGDHCVFGGRTTVSGHLRIASQSQFAGLSGVSNDVEKPGAYGGYPLMPLKQSLKVHATFVHLVEMRKSLHRLLKKFGIHGEESP